MAKKTTTKIDRAAVDREVAQLEHEAETYQPSPSHLDLVERSRVYLVNVVRDEVVAAIGTDQLGQGPSLLMTLMFCRGVFTDAESLYTALCAQPWSRAAWQGRKKNLRPVYARLRERLEDSLFCLIGEGFYGFWLRASSEQRAEAEQRREQRIARVRLAKRRSRDRRELG